MPAPAVIERWEGRDVSIDEIEAQLARLRAAVSGDDGQPHQRTSVMTHVAWVPPEWRDAAERTLEGLAERHPSRTVILVPTPDTPGDKGEGGGLHASLSVRCFALGDQMACGEVVELYLGGERASAPASLVLPLAISDLPVFVRWRGEPPFGAAPWAQLVGVADRVIVDSSEWEELRYRELAEAFDQTAVSDIAWARTLDWRLELAERWPAIRDQEIRIQGPRAEATLLRAWLTARLGVALPAVEPAGDLTVVLDGDQLAAPAGQNLSPSDLLSAELDHFARDRIYEEAVRAAAAFHPGV